MKIKVRLLTGATNSYTFEDGDTSANVKKKLRSKMGVEADQIQLVFGGRVLNDEIKLNDAGVTEGAVIHAVLNLRG